MIGAAYKTKTDDLNGSNWNFAEQLGWRFPPQSKTLAYFFDRSTTITQGHEATNKRSSFQEFLRIASQNSAGYFFLERPMRVLIVIALLVGATLMILFVLGDLARELSRDSFHAPPDLDSSDDWESEGDELSNAVPPFVDWTERRTVGRNSVGRMRGDDAAARSNALDDLHSAL